jgi:hypothetical protein
MVARQLADQGIVAQPQLVELDLDDWVVLSLPQQPPMRDDRPDPRPKPEFFDHLESVRLDSEREVEMHFVSPLFRELGYGEEQEAAGFRLSRSVRDCQSGLHAEVAGSGPVHQHPRSSRSAVSKSVSEIGLANDSDQAVPC